MIDWAHRKLKSTILLKKWLSGIKMGDLAQNKLEPKIITKNG